MDIEFHYYLTYLIATRSGFAPQDARTLAYASQYTDDNTTVFEIDKGLASFFKNYISQTMNILNPKPKLFRIYPIFHFVPGEPMASMARRKDGRLHWLNTTPGGHIATELLDQALASNSMYRIGIASHAFADTWAHQNFIGYYDAFNSMAGLLEAATPNIGHADAQHNPDWPALAWKDRRLLPPGDRVDNINRFITAVRHMFRRLRRHTDPAIGNASLLEQENQLAAEITLAIGDRDQSNEYRSARLSRYKALAGSDAFGATGLPDYVEDAWMSEAVTEDVRGLRDRSDTRWARWDPFTDKYSWRNPEGYRETNWYRFQMAVKEHQALAIQLLNAELGDKMELEEF